MQIFVKSFITTISFLMVQLLPIQPAVKSSISANTISTELATSLEKLQGTVSASRKMRISTSSVSLPTLLILCFSMLFKVCTATFHRKNAC